MNGRAIDDERERVAVERSHCLRQHVANVAEQHILGDSLASLIRCIDDGREGAVDGAAGDHVVAGCVGSRVGGLDERLLALQHESASRRLAHSDCSLIEEEYAILTDSLQLASNLRNILAERGRHCSIRKT